MLDARYGLASALIGCAVRRTLVVLEYEKPFPNFFLSLFRGCVADRQLGNPIFACGRGLRLGNCCIPFYTSSDTRQPAEPRARDRIAVRIASRSVGRKSVVRLVKPSSCTRKAERIVPRIFTRSARGPRTSTRRAPGVAPYVESGAPSHFRLLIQ